MTHVFEPVPQPVVPVHGEAGQFPVHRIYCVGRNYEAHAREMGATSRETPFFFMKPADAAVAVADQSIGHITYPVKAGERMVGGIEGLDTLTVWVD